jgi:hypothetical protein
LLQGDVGIDASVVKLIVMGEVNVACLGLQVADFFVVGLESSCKLVDAHVGGGKLLSGDSGASFHCGGEPVGDSSCNLGKLISAEADESFSRARG